MVPNKMNSDFACIQCNHATAKPFYMECEDFYLQKPYKVNYYRCDECGLVQQSPVLSDVASFYEAYPIHQKKSLMHRLMRQWVMGGCYFQIRKFLAEKKQCLLIDLGCGDGGFLDSARDPKLILVGFEVNKNHAENLSNLLKVPIYSDDQALLQNYEGRADVVTMHFVLEHLTNLNGAFDTVQRLLKPEGIFFFSVPNISSWEARLFGKKWHNLDAPRHISFPESESIRQLAKRWGFEVIRYQGIPFPNGVAGSLPVVLTGKFRFWLYLLCLPLGILLSRISPDGNRAYSLRKRMLHSAK